MSRRRCHVDAHPFHDIYSREVKAFRGWQARWRAKGVEPGCFGIYLYTVATRDLKEQFRSIAHKGPQSAKKRPSWCSAKLFHNWSTYKGKFAAGIPLAIYADPKKRREWMRNRSTRPISPREAAAELLRRKGLAP